MRVEGFLCTWCDKFNRAAKTPTENSTMLHLTAYPTFESPCSDFCNRACLMNYLDRNQSVGI